MKYFAILAALILIFLNVEIKAQTNLYLPKNFVKTYEKGTRSFDGKPGANYSQNSSDYKISVELEPRTRTVKGIAKIVYKNNSQDTLKKIYFRMYQDLYRPITSRDRAITAKELTDGISLYSLKINNIPMTEASISRSETTMIVFPEQPVLPASSMQVDIEWSFTIPNGTSIRMGTKDSTTFVVGYWYPQIAVYDDINGWDELNYNGNTEFYNDFNTYDVEIKMPYDYNVWATGTLQNPEKVFSSSILNKYNEAKISDNIISIIDSNSIGEKNYYNKKSGHNIWHYKANNVTDFVFGASNNALWDAASTDVGTGERVLVSAAYNKTSKDFYSVCKVARDAVIYFSNETPGIAFPYPTLTIFNGQFRGGMEYPMFVNDRSAKTFNEMVDVTTHEIAHQYFPFYMGINEKKYTWMEEGMAQMMPEELQDRLSDNIRKRKANTTRYENFAGSDMEASMMTTAYLLKGDAFSMNAYFKSSVIYNLLRDYFGREKYNSIMKEYISRWNGKHPTPYDFFFTLNEASGEDLEWFWKPWFFDKGYPELSIDAVSEQPGKTNIIIKNFGTLPVPVEVFVKYSDGTEKLFSEKMDIWKDGKKQLIFSDESGKEIKSIILGSDVIPDINSANNSYAR